MKKSLLLSFVLFVAVSFAQKAPHLKFKEPKHDLGYIQKGDIDTLNYEFTNDGGQPLVFKDFKVECSCTKVFFPKDPVLPGATGFVMVVFDSKGWNGFQDRKVVILSNAKNDEETLHFKCEVLAKRKLGF